MPTYTHICQATECNNEWDDFYSMATPPPTTCPKCKKETAKRVISSGGSKGVVELTGHDLIAKTKSDAQKFKKEVYASEKLYANVVSDNTYQGLQKSIDKNRR